MTTEREAHLLRDAYAAGITQRRELANFMAQVSHESGGLQSLEERFRYTRNAEQISSNVRSALREGRDTLEAARLEALAGRPEPLAELMYGGRMGNSEPGDGHLYRGRGYMQLTGKNQYAAAGEALGLDLVGNPDLAAQPEHASRIATWYWQQNVPRHAREDARAAGAAINGADPPNGLDDRVKRFERWEREITPERIQALAAAHGTWVGTDSLLREGDRGDGVRNLQSALAELGSTDARDRALQVDGVFGGRTTEAVRAFQRAQGLDVDGIVGPATRGALERLGRLERAEPSTVLHASGASPLDALLAAARSGDPAALRSAMDDFSETAFGRHFYAVSAERANDPAPNAPEAAPEQSCAR